MFSKRTDKTGYSDTSSAMALPATVVELHPMDLFNICARLRARRERHGPRALRFELTPQAADPAQLGHHPCMRFCDNT